MVGSTDPLAAVAYQINSQHSGASTDTTIAPPFTKRWSTSLPGPISYPLIADGRIFVTTSMGVQNGTSLYAIDAKTGSVIWGPAALGGLFPWANATLEGTRVFALNSDGILSAFDAATGTIAWTVAVTGAVASGSFSSPPTAFGGLVYVSGLGNVRAFAETNGKLSWAAQVNGGDNSSPAVAQAGVYVSYACPHAYDLSRVGGAVYWTYGPASCTGGGGNTPVLANGRLFVRDTGSNVILDAAMGTLVGTFNAGPPPAFDATHGYFAVPGSLTARPVAALQQVAWTFTGDGTLISAPMVVNGRVYVAGSSGMLYAIDAATGSAVWSDNVGAAVTGPGEFGQNGPVTALGAGDGVLVVPAGKTLVAY